MNLAGMKYKDELPLNTINKVREIFGRLGLLTVETTWRNSVDNFYSVSVAVENTDLTTNGKGTSSEFALASAYGELMERVQNLANYRLSLDMRPETMEYLGFIYAPDEKPMTVDELLGAGDGWIAAQLSGLGPEVDKKQLLTEWQKMSYEEIPADYIALPYCNLNKKNLSYIPIKMICKMYMSNGMCAGNTPEEALVQGIAEIFERYVNKVILRQRVVPPTIPRKFLSKYPRIEAMIAGIEASGSFEVVVKDCSLGKKLPVVGVIFINKSDQSYFVKFGAHPKFEIAAERTLTELLQGQDVRRMMGVREFSFRSQADNPENYMGILVTGSGVYPSEFFSRNYSYPFTEFKEPEFADNREMLAYEIGLLAGEGYETYVRDVSFLGFPSYHIIVPGLSEVEEFDDIKSINDYACYNQFKKTVRQLDRLDASGAEAIDEFLQKLSPDNNASVMEVMNLPVRGKGFPWYYSNIQLFRTAIYYWKGDNEKAYETFDRFVQSQRASLPQSVVTYYKCVRDYLATRMGGLSEKDAVSTLGLFYSMDIIRGVIAEFNSPAKTLSYLGQLNCWNCEKCRFSGQCLYPPMERVYKRLKECQTASNLDQKKLINLL
jgi:ribosomal protein S12 methylthiotransferase accessory factor